MGIPRQTAEYEMIKTPIFVKTKIYEVAYTCPHCKQATRYEANSMPTKAECDKCFKKLDWKVILMRDDKVKNFGR